VSQHPCDGDSKYFVREGNRLTRPGVTPNGMAAIIMKLKKGFYYGGNFLLRTATISRPLFSFHLL
jgi:hypothetical protein